MVATRDLRWVTPWLKQSYYDEKCKKHEKQFTTKYCTVCMGHPICNACWTSEEASQHPGHPVVTVCRCSRRTAIKITEISKYLNVSGIQHGIINDDKVLYLNRDEKDGKKLESINLPPKHKHCRVCEVCKGKMGDNKGKIVDSSNIFCSIACKFSTMNVAVEEKNNAVKDVAEEENNPKKKRRKGIPYRSPFF